MYMQQTVLPRRGSLRRVRFGAVMDEWLASRRAEVKPTTCATYQCIADNHIRPRLGSMPVSRVDNAAVADFLDALAAENVSLGTAQGVANVLRQMLRFAQGCGCRADAEKCRLSGKAPKRRVDVLSSAEQERLMTALGERPTGCDLGILLALKTGLRVGEVCALRWGDIPRGEGTLHVRATVQRITNESGGGTRVYIGDPKSEQSNRKIPLTPQLCGLLEAQRGDDDCFVLTGAARPKEPRDLQRRFRRVLGDAGVRQVNFHVLRHTFATKFVDKGFDIKALSMLLGHANVSTTLSIYVHPSMETMRGFMEKMED